jgi:hypothetical protein
VTFKTKNIWCQILVIDEEQFRDYKQSHKPVSLSYLDHVLLGSMLGLLFFAFI